MAEAWYYLENGKQAGPVNAGQLRQLAADGRLQPGSLVWKEGLAEWIPASRLNGLFSADHATPPPPPPSSPPITPKVQSAICRHCGAAYRLGLRTCPRCGKGTMTAAQAYGTFNPKKGGFGILDLIPGVRDLPAAAKVVLIVVILGGVGIVVSLISTLAGSGPTRPESGRGSEAVETGMSVGNRPRDEAARFVRTWVASGSESAVAALDSRAVYAVQNAVRTIKLKSFDGNVSEVGDGTVTVYATGSQYPVTECDVAPVVRMGSVFVPMQIRISVAKDTGKVIAVVPQLEGVQ